MEAFENERTKIARENSPGGVNNLKPPDIMREVRTWDNWYYCVPDHEVPELKKSLSNSPDVSRIIEGTGALFLLGYLNAPRAYYDGELGPNKHHLHSRLGVALTRDFVDIAKLADDAFLATPDEGSIWSGSFYPVHLEQEHKRLAFFYTSRDMQSPFGLSQQIRCAVTSDYVTFNRLPLTIRPDPRWHDVDTLAGDTSIHSFRDPFPFRIGDEFFLLVSAKSPLLPKGVIGERPGENAVIAVYRLRFKKGEILAESTPLCFSANMSEMEVPSIYWDHERNTHVIMFSSHRSSDYLSRQADENGLPIAAKEELGEFREFDISTLPQLLISPPARPIQVQSKLVHEAAPGSYGNRVVPELGGRILGFDNSTGLPALGGYRRSLRAC